MPDGTITIKFYANNTLGKIDFQEVIVRKDIENPIISILSPTMNEVFEIPPAYEITIAEANLDKIWYTIDGGTNIKFITELIGVIDLTLWNQLPNGYVTIRFYANDTLGNISYDEVIVVKDTEGPIISIVAPAINDEFELPPAYEITVIDVNLDRMWYTYDEGTTKILISSMIGILNQTLWNQLPNGYVTIRFYANDTLGNISYDEVIVVKDTPTPNPPSGGIPGYNAIILLGMVSLIAAFIIRREFNKGKERNI